MKFLFRRRDITAYNESYCHVTGKGKTLSLLLLFLLMSLFVFAQQITVTGKVSSGDSALSGASVAVKNSKTATKTNDFGAYAIEVLPNATLIFTAVGYTTQEIKVDSRSSVNVGLVPQNQQLGDVVVVGYGTQRKGSITGAVSSINSSDLIRTPSSTTSGALVGKMQGITARQPTGRPGAGTNIQIRNLGAPLYVIDGVPQSEGQFNNISAEDIESISVLKDASASIYGFRASNGVVLVTTKKGKTGKAALNVTSYYQLQSVTRYPQASNAYTYMRAIAESDQNAGLAPSVTADVLEKWRKGTDSGFTSTNYRDYIIQKYAPQSYVNLSASGGSEKINFYLSLSGLKQDGILKYYNFNRWNFQSNVEGTIFKGLKIGTQLSGRIESRNEPASTTTASTYDNPFLAILTMWPTEHVYANDNPNYINADINNPSRNPLIYNPDIIGKQKNVWHNFASIFYATLDLPFGLSAKATYSFNYKQNANELQRNTFNTFSYKPATNTYAPVAFNLALRNKAREDIQENFAQVQLNYRKTVHDHAIAATAAYEYFSSTDQYASISSIPPSNYSSIINLLDINSFTNTYAEVKRASLIGRVNYDYKQTYLLELLGRYDGSYLYAPGKRWGMFPGISVGWRVSNEKFFRNLDASVVSNIKLRASWGKTGQEVGVSPFDYLAGGNFGSGSYVFDNGLATGIAIRGLPITNITWVNSTSKNIGLDLGFFQNKLTTEFDVFRRDLTGIPAAKYDVLLPSEVGYTLPAQNLNSERSQGIEGIITYKSNKGKVGYTLSANATLVRSMVGDVYKPRFGNSWDQYRNQTDHRYPGIDWGYRVIGQFQSTDQIKNYSVNNDGQGNKTQLPGDLMFEDVNGDGVIDDLDQRPIGYAIGGGGTFEGNNPRMSFGATFGLNYKGLSITTDWAGGAMQSYYRIFELAIPFQANHNAPEYIFEDRWHRADLYDPNSAWIPGKYPAIRRSGSGSHVNYTTHNSFWITNVNYIRLKNLEISYAFPKAFLKRLGIAGLKVYVNGTNLFSFDSLKNVQIDPEIAMSNGLVYPIMKLYTFGININL